MRGKQLDWTLELENTCLAFKDCYLRFLVLRKRDFFIACVLIIRSHLWYYHKMNKNKLEKQVNNRYTELVDSLIVKAILNNEAVSMRQNVSKNNDLSQVFSKVVINDYLLEIDFEIDIKYGFSITEISCMLQEQIKNDIEKNTKFKVKKINILVKNVTV